MFYVPINSPVTCLCRGLRFPGAISALRMRPDSFTLKHVNKHKRHLVLKPSLLSSPVWSVSRGSELVTRCTFSHPFLSPLVLMCHIVLIRVWLSLRKYNDNAVTSTSKHYRHIKSGFVFPLACCINSGRRNGHSMLLEAMKYQFLYTYTHTVAALRLNMTFCNALHSHISRDFRYSRG